MMGVEFYFTMSDLTERRPERYDVKVIPGVPFKISPRFDLRTTHPEEFTKLHQGYDEGTIIDEIGINIAGHVMGSIRVLSIALGTDEFKSPIIFPGGDIRPYAFYPQIYDLNSRQIGAVQTKLNFGYNSYIADMGVDDYALRKYGKTDKYTVGWVDTSNNQYGYPAFRRIEIPHISFIITGIENPKSILLRWPRWLPRP